MTDRRTTAEREICELSQQLLEAIRTADLIESNAEDVVSRKLRGLRECRKEAQKLRNGLNLAFS